jgi:hypothetical protein
MARSPFRQQSTESRNPRRGEWMAGWQGRRRHSCGAKAMGKLGGSRGLRRIYWGGGGRVTNSVHFAEISRYLMDSGQSKFKNC